MYKVVSEGKIVAYTEKPPYVKVVSGVSVPCNVREAEGIVAGGNCYNLIDIEEAFPGSPTAWVHKVDGNDVLFTETQRIDTNEAKIDEVDDTALAGLMATTDLYEELLNKGVL